MDKLQVEYIPIDKVTPYERNARKHTDADVQTIVNSIKTFEMCDPIGVWGEKNIIVEGHGRLLALKQLGYDEVPVIHLDHLTDEQRRAYALAHNKTAEMSEWDYVLQEEELNSITSFDMSDFGFDFDFGDEKEKEIIEDEPPEVDDDKEPMCKLGDIWQLGNHRLMCGDSTDREQVERLMNGEKAFLCVTDPPYNTNNGEKDKLIAKFRTNERVKTTDNIHLINDNMSYNEFETFLEKSFYNMNESLKGGGAFYIWHAYKSQREFENAINLAGLQVRQQLVWVKNHFSLGMQDYEWKHELCFYGWTNGTHYFVDDRTQTTIYEDQIDLKKMKKEDMLKLLEQIFSDKVSTTVIHEDKPMRNALHPTMKPIKLLARQIRNSSRKDDIVLDIFGGSGSTLIACEQLGRKCYMMELEPKYCDVIIQRFENFTGKKAVKIDETQNKG